MTESPLEAMLARQTQDDLRNLMATEQGQRVLVRLLEYAGLFRSSFSMEANATAFHEGQRDVALWMLEQCQQVSADALPRLLEARAAWVNKTKTAQEEKAAQEDLT